MSIHHEVSVHCDGCGEWEWGKDRTTRARRKAGWRAWKDERGHWRHLCPRCPATLRGEAPSR